MKRFSPFKRGRDPIPERPLSVGYRTSSSNRFRARRQNCREVAAFPNGKHDNQVDSLTRFLRATRLWTRPSAACFFFAGEGEGKTDGTASTFRWTSRPKEALLWGKRASRARLPRPVIRRGLPGWKRRDCRGAKPKEAPK